MAQSTPVLEGSDGRSANLPAAFSLRPSGGRAEPRCNGASPREFDSRWQQLSALLGSRIGRRQALGGADHDQGPPLLVFRRRLHLISREIEGDLVILGGSGRKVERVPINRDFAVANPQEAPKVDDRGTHLPALINDHVDDPPHILSSNAADLPPQHRVVLFEHRGGHFSGSPTACLIPWGFPWFGRVAATAARASEGNERRAPRPCPSLQS